MKVVSLSCVLVFIAGALSMGCVAQAGTDTSSTEQELTNEPAAVQQQQQEEQQWMRAQKLKRSPALVVTTETDGTKAIEPQFIVKDQGGSDPGGNVTDDGDGKEPDPHPWHSNTSSATLASH